MGSEHLKKADLPATNSKNNNKDNASNKANVLLTDEIED